MLPEGAEYEYRHISTQYPQGQNMTVDLPEIIAVHFAYLKKIKTQMKELEVAEDKLKAEICGMMGEAEYATLGNKLACTWKTSTRTSLDQKKLEQEHPALVEKYKKTSTIRTFRVTTKGE